MYGNTVSSEPIPVILRSAMRSFQALDARPLLTAIHFFVAVGNVHAVNHEGNAFAARDAAGDSSNEIAEIFLTNGSERGINHAFYFQASTLAAIVAASVNTISSLDRQRSSIAPFACMQQQIAAERLRVRKSGGARVRAIRATENRG